MAQPNTSPIFSTREDETALGDEIDRFVITLAEQVDRLQDAELEGDLDLLKQLAKDLGARAARLGYAPMTEIATAVAEACVDRKVEDAAAAMVGLTEIGGRIRRGHRGSA